MADVDFAQLGRELRAARIEQGRGFEATAAELGIAKATLHSIERGDAAGTRFETIAAYARLVKHRLARSLPTAEPATEGAE